MTRRSPGRATRQILSGSELAPPRETIGGHSTDGERVSFAFKYLVTLAVLVVVTALVWAVWGHARGQRRTAGVGGGIDRLLARAVKSPGSRSGTRGIVGVSSVGDLFTVHNASPSVSGFLVPVW